MTTTGANDSSVYFLGRFYDSVFVRRKGVTSLTWPKPKLKFKLQKSVRHDSQMPETARFIREIDVKVKQKIAGPTPAKQDHSSTSKQ